MPSSYGPYGPRRPLRQEDVILEANAANPDFALPGAGLGRGGAGGRGRGRGRGAAVGMANAGLGAGRSVNLGSQHLPSADDMICRYPGAM